MPNDWTYELKKSTLRVVGLPLYKDRLKGMMRRLGNDLELSRRTVTLFVDFSIEQFGFGGEYQTQTSLWRGPHRYEGELGEPHVSEVAIQGPETIKVVLKSGDSVALPAVISAYVENQSNYSWLRLGFPPEKLVGAVLMREAWGGPFPKRKYEQL